jgi:Arc/MetJ-type ribon-helix-helix transcriptional regulator
MASISPDNEQFLDQAIADGRFANRSEALDVAIRLLRRREELIRAVNAGVDQLNEGRYTEYGDADLERFVADIKAKAAEMTTA